MKRLLWILPALLMMLASCSGRSEEDILLTVPKDTNYFNLVNLKAVTADLGEEGRAQIDRLLAENASKGRPDDARWSYFLGPDSQVDFSGPLVAFEFNNNILFSFYAKDASKFRDGIGQALGAELKEQDGVWKDADGTVFIKDSQVWFASSYPEISTADIAALSQTKEEGSVLAVDCARELATKGDDFCSFINLGETLQGSWNQQTRMVLNAIFDDPAYVVSSHNFEKGKAVGESVFLNYKGQPAELALKLQKINEGDLRKFDGKGNLFLVLGVNPDMMHNLVRMAKNFGGVPADLQETLESLDGNVAVALMQADKYAEPSSMSFSFTFGSKGAAAKAADFMRSGPLLGMLASLPSEGEEWKVFSEGDRCCLVYGDGTGAGIDTVAEDFKGACLGIAVLPSFIQNVTGGSNVSDYLDSFVLTLHDDGKGARIRTVLATKSDNNALVTLMRYIEDINR